MDSLLIKLSIFVTLFYVGTAFADLVSVEPVESTCAVTQAELDRVAAETGGYEITVDEFCSL